MILELPRWVADKIVVLGEPSYGTNRVTPVLADGRQMHEVFLAWGREIVKIGTRAVSSPDDLDFRIADIVDVISEVR